ncbi:MAG: maleylpyruvate isomerase [Maritimibacter sp.]|jgi:maleylpyruvate isomerase|uniref:hypothetical protein n=1 Tax=Maritimibacter sp. TaxID=2003363 RepID=UPI001DBAD705|nr:hypothetical protein [Maritimibacter sp.]MBL6430261.1 maleylpyruvate isomerase [Maritimibacter sp.]
MTDDDARAALRARQGAGARYDAETAPSGDLLVARRATADFARCLNRLSDAELTKARHRVIAEVSLQARAMALAVKALRAPLTEEEEEWRPDVGMTVTLPAHALRYLFDHSQIHLNVEWRDLDAAAWDERVHFPGWIDAVGRVTPSIRARTLWTAAQSLDTGVRIADLPPDMQRDLP